MGYTSEGHKATNYKIRVTKNGHTITRMKRHMSTTPISAEDYLRKDILTANTLQTYDKLNEIIDCFAEINKHEHLNNMAMEEKDIRLKTVLPPRHTFTEHSKEVT